MADTQIFKDGILRETGANRKETFIPTNRPQNHAANLFRLPDGRLSCVWFGGTMEGMPDISIHQSIFDEATQTWSQATVFEDNPERSEQNPLLFNAPDGDVWLLYTSQVLGNQDTSVVRRRISKDGGETFSEPHTLIDVPGTFIRQPILNLDGTLLLPVFHCKTTAGQRWTGNQDTSALYSSNDQGKTWNITHVPNSLGCVHMNPLYLGKGELTSFFRSRWADAIYQSDSHDAGKAWSEPRATTLPNNNSSIQAIKLKDGRIALVYNHSSVANATGRRTSLYDDLDDNKTASITTNKRQAFWGAPRAPLSLVFSNDSGKTWGERLDLEVGDGYCLSNNSTEHVNRELSYPSICEAPDGSLDIAFTYFRQAIKHIRLKL